MPSLFRGDIKSDPDATSPSKKSLKDIEVIDMTGDSDDDDDGCKPQLPASGAGTQRRPNIEPHKIDRQEGTDRNSVKSHVSTAESSSHTNDKASGAFSATNKEDSRKRKVGVEEHDDNRPAKIRISSNVQPRPNQDLLKSSSVPGVPEDSSALQDADRSLQEMRGKLREAKAKEATALEDRKSLAEELKHVKSDLSRKDKTIAELERLGQESVVFKSRAATMKIQTEDAEKKIKEFEKQIAIKDDATNQLRQEKDELLQKLGKIQVETQQVRAQLEAGNEKLRMQIANLEQAKSKISEQEVQIQKLQTQGQQLKSKISEQEVQIEKLQTQEKQAKSRIRRQNAQIARLEEKEQQATSIIREQDAKIESLNTAIGNQKQQLADSIEHRKETQKWKEKLDSMEADMQNLQVSCDEKDKKIQRLETQTNRIQDCGLCRDDPAFRGWWEDNLAQLHFLRRQTKSLGS